jgi:rod shape-determining protein MreD
MAVWLVIRTLISGIIILYIQILFMPRLEILGVTPNLFLGWIVYQVWKKPVNMLIPILFVLGVCYDLTMPTMLGLQTILFILLAIGVDEFHRPLEKDSYITMAITLGLVSIVYSLILFVVYGIQSGFSPGLFLSMLFLILYNCIVSAISSAIFVFISHLKLDFRHG